MPKIEHARASEMGSRAMRVRKSVARGNLWSTLMNISGTFTSLSALVLLVTTAVLLASPAESLNRHQFQQQLGEQDSSGQTAARFQPASSNRTVTGSRAKISLESKSFDLDEEEDLKKLLEDEPTAHPEQELGQSQKANESRATHQRPTAPRRKSSRRLSNLWAMFLPGGGGSETSSDSDYENESLDNGSETEGPVVAMSNRSNGTSSQASQDGPDGNRPSAGGEQLISSGSNGSQRAWVSGASAAVNGSARDNATTTSASLEDDQPVRLITGALSSNQTGSTSGAATVAVDQLLATPNMNEITSNIMGSLGVSGSSTSAPSVGERESSTSVADSEQEGSGTPASNRTAESSNFERWLSKISESAASKSARQRQGAAGGESANTTSSQSASTTTTTTGRPVRGSWHNSAGQFARNATKGALQASQPGGFSKRPQSPMQQHLQASLASSGKGFPKREAQQQQQQQLQVATESQNNRPRYQSHPFQQQIRQQQAQLIHGIRQPVGHASTISVSTTDGASNTSLAFGSHYIPQINPINGGAQQETSQVVNSTQSPAGLTNHNVLGSGQWTFSNSSAAGASSSSSSSANLEQEQANNPNAAYQSQDEILRQVTSAINFEQQQLAMNQQKRESSNSAEQQQRATGEPEDENGAAKYMTPDGASRAQQLIKSSSGATTTTSTTSSPLESMLKAIGNFQSSSSAGSQPQQQQQAGNQSALGSGDIDKSFELLAEKVRQLASQQQQLQAQQQQQQQMLVSGASGLANQTSAPQAAPQQQVEQPSWLRPQQLANAMAAAGGPTTGAPSGKVDLQELLLMKQSSGNLTSLLAETGGLPLKPQQAQVEQIRELLQRHEKTKNELKSSQETMMALMRQMMQLKATPAGGGGGTTGGGGGPSPPPSSVAPSRPPSASDENSPEDQQVASLMSGPDQAGANEVAAGPNDVSNVGWLPLSHAKPGGVPAQAGPAPPSPATLMKNRVRFPQHAHPHPQHAHQRPPPPVTGNIGMMLAPGPQQVELDQRIIGLPIALLNNDEVELSHDQLENAARLAAEQLGAIPPSAAATMAGRQQQQQHRARVGGPNNKFVPRVVPTQNQVAQNRLQQQQQAGGEHLQRLLQSNSPQALAQLQKLASLQLGPTGEAQQQQQPGLSNEQQRHNLMQLERLASLLPPLQSGSGEAGEQDASQPDQPMPGEPPSGGSMRDQLNKLESSGANATSRPQAASQQDGEPQDQRQQSAGERPRAENAPGGQSGRTGNNFQRQAQQQAQQQQQRRQQQQQQQQQQQLVDSQQQQPPSPMGLPVGQYGQIPRPGSESLLRDFRPLLDSNHFLPHQQPARQLYEEPQAPGGGGYITTTSTTGGTGPPLKLREMSFYRPFGFRGHHAISYQASPTVAAMFPRFVAQPESVAGSSGVPARLTAPFLVPGSRPGILRHMTPIRATITEGQRLISQMLPHQLADQLGHQAYHRFHSQAYPTHNHLGQTLPIPPMRHHLHHPHPHAHNQPPLRRNSLMPARGPTEADLPVRRQQQMISASRVRTRNMDHEMQEPVPQDAAEEVQEIVFANDEQAAQLSNEIDLNQLINSDQNNNNNNYEFDLPPHAHQETMSHIPHHHARPGRYMRAKQDHPHTPLPHTILRIDKPSGPVLMKVPCVPVHQDQNATTTTTTQIPSTSSISTSTEALNVSTSTNSPPNITTQTMEGGNATSTTTSTTTMATIVI